MGVKFDAVKDDKIFVKHFTDNDFDNLTKRINNFLNPFLPKFDWESPDTPLRDIGFRIVPLGIAHSTEVKPYTGNFGCIETSIWYHAIITYKKVEEDD